MDQPTLLELRLTRIRDKEQSNCIGTALYLTGEQDEDVYVSAAKAHRKFLRKLRQTGQPITGCLVAWESVELPITRLVNHMGVVVHTNPILVTQREGCNGQISEYTPIEQINSFGLYQRSTVFYYVPRLLESKLAR
jgi:hypothetical protein